MAEPWLDRPSQLPILATWKAASREPGTLGAPASCRLGAGHGGSRRQGEFLKPQHFVVRTRCGRDARGSQGEASQNGCYPAPPSRPGKDRIMTFAYLY